MTLVLYYLMVVVAFITSRVLSVDALKCYECNSKLNASCDTLVGPDSEKYLHECVGEHNGTAICRKIYVTITVNNEELINRECGWLTTEANSTLGRCLSADHEGFKQTICTCTTDACNAAPTIGRGSSAHWLGALLTGAAVFLLTGSCPLPSM